MDPDDSIQSVIALGVDYPTRERMSAHRHKRGQLIFVISGSMRVETEGGIWITTPGRACWIPGGVVHTVIYTKASKARAAYIREDYLDRLPNRCCVLQLSALLRELVIAAVILAGTMMKAVPPGD